MLHERTRERVTETHQKQIDRTRARRTCVVAADVPELALMHFPSTLGHDGLSIPGTPALDPIAVSALCFQALRGDRSSLFPRRRLLFFALHQMNPKDARAVAGHYRLHYRRSLRHDLRSLPLASDRDRACDYLNGDPHRAFARAIQRTIAIPGFREERLVRLFDHYPRCRGEKLKAAIDTLLDERHLHRVLKSCSPTLNSLVHSQLDGNREGVYAARLGWALQRRLFRERRLLTALSQIPRRAWSRALRDAEARFPLPKLIGRCRTILDAIRRDDAARTYAGILVISLQSRRPSLPWIFRALSGRTPEFRTRVQEKFERMSGSSLPSAFSRMPFERGSVALSLLESGSCTTLGKLRAILCQIDERKRLPWYARIAAKLGHRVPERDLVQLLQGLSQTSIRSLSSQYQRETGRELRHDLRRTLSGDSLFRALLAIRGRPTSIEDALLSVRAQLEYEKLGFGHLLVGWMRRHVTPGGFFDRVLHGVERLSIGSLLLHAGSPTLQRPRRILNRLATMEQSAWRDEVLTLDERRRFVTWARYAIHDLELFREKKERFSDLASAGLAGLTTFCLAAPLGWWQSALAASVIAPPIARYLVHGIGCDWRVIPRDIARSLVKRLQGRGGRRLAATLDGIREFLG